MVVEGWGLAAGGYHLTTTCPTIASLGVQASALQCGGAMSCRSALCMCV